MPTYEYRCGECGVKFERFHSIKADPVRDCPECGEKGSVTRLISGGAGLIFKGDGFYITDYRSDSYKSAQKKEQSSSDKPSSDSSDASSSKSADKGSSGGSAEKTGGKTSGKTSGKTDGSA